MRIQVTARSGTFWRSGVQFGPQPKEPNSKDFSPEAWAAILAEPKLKVVELAEPKPAKPPAAPVPEPDQDGDGIPDSKDRDQDGDGKFESRPVPAAKPAAKRAQRKAPAK